MYTKVVTTWYKYKDIHLKFVCYRRKIFVSIFSLDSLISDRHALKQEIMHNYLDWVSLIDKQYSIIKFSNYIH